MDTSKVIELGKVSEETKGIPNKVLENSEEPFSGPHSG
jgi:hypothetical protein